MTAGFQSPPLSLAGTTLGGSSLRGSLGGGESVRQDVVDGITRLDARIRVRRTCRLARRLLQRRVLIHLVPRPRLARKSPTSS